jgi:damage-control phosphatase, subfamily I
MKLYPECGPCMLNRSLLFCSGGREGEKYKVVRETCKIFAECFNENTTTTEAAHLRNESIKKITGDRNPMKDLKEESILAAEKILPDLEKYVASIRDEKRRFFICLKIALAGNIIEFGARDHKVDLKKLEREAFDVIEGPLSIDDSEKIYEKVARSKKILYVTDNSGELLFDIVLIKELKKYSKVIVAPLSTYVQDDASVEEIKRVGIDKLAPIVPRSDSIGVWFERCTREFLKEWDDADFIIVKGMGCYETLSDYPNKTKGKVGLLMKAKCVPVAKDVGVPVGSAVIKIM